MRDAICGEKRFYVDRSIKLIQKYNIWFKSIIKVAWVLHKNKKIK